ncbi:MAG: Na+:solute symporter [Calditrichaeota bacterium]|nr:Na+:solute symporter [Calditrichota bacterium]
MQFLDFVIIVVYFILVLGSGFLFRKKAAQNLESYFLGGRKISWIMLAMSGSVSNFDITGTMWIVSMLFILGMKSMWIHWMWGFLMGAFFMAYMGKWVRRSKVMTAAEWMKTRFGEDGGGKAARTMYAIMAILTQASFIGYAFQGIGKFASVYIPLPETTLALMIIGVTTLYVLVGGLYSVVITDVIQTIILSVAGLLIAFLAFKTVSPEMLNRSVSAEWLSLKPVWRLPELSGTPNRIYEWFGALVIVWVLKGLLLNSGGPAQMYDFQRFLAAKDSRDASKVGAAWSFFLIIRWAMAMGIVVIAVSGALNVTDPEKVMPVVLNDYLPVGIRGIVIAGLLSAFMSTFSSTVNSGASYLVKDVWQNYFSPAATQKQLIRASYWSTILIVLLGIVIGFQAQSIGQIWNWMMMALGAGVIIPNALRWYWWRMNGWGYAAGMLSGIVLSLLVLFRPETPMFVSFPVITVGSLLCSVGGSLITKQTDRAVVLRFYSNVKPFGLWRPIKEKIKTQNLLKTSSDRPQSAVLNVVLGMILIAGLYLFPMYLVVRRFDYVFLFSGAALLCGIVLYFTWYKNLPPKGEV